MAQTAIRVENTNFLFITQQYKVGLYVVIYTADADWKTVGTPDQFGVTMSETKYHAALRKKARKTGQLVEDHCFD